MKRQAITSLGLSKGIDLPACGRAARSEAKGIAHREIWRLPAEDEAVGDRLIDLGKAGIGGFLDGGVDEGGVWLVRRAPSAMLAEKIRERKGPWGWQEAVRVAIAIARALAAGEKASLFAGPLAPDSVGIDENGGIYLPAAALVGALLGAKESGGRGALTIAPHWTPPEQADGAVWDSAANRYALGLLLYRLIAGEHPFGGAGLRHALDEAARREAPPFVESVAAELPSGLQSLVLRLLDPDRGRRPSRAESIAADLERFLREGNATVTSLSAGQEPPRRRAAGEERSKRTAPEPAAEKPRARVEPPEDAAASVPVRSKGRTADRSGRAESKPRSAMDRVKSLWPLGLGAAIAVAAVATLKPAPEPPRLAKVSPEVPLASTETTAQDCASCHTRQAAEWRRSVMAHSVKSPLFNALESLIEEQVGRDFDCPNGAGILRRADGSTACRDRESGVAVTGSGGEHWCVNCHSPADNLASAMPAWDGRPGGDARSRRPVRDLLSERGLEGISCGFCHQVHGPVGPRGSRGYQGNPTWVSFETGAVFPMRPEDGRGLLGIGNSGYELRPEELLLSRSGAARDAVTGGGGVDPVVHKRPSESARAYLKTSEFCGSCHDVRLFGTDSLGASKGEHFKRLRNAYSEWVSWAKDEERAGRAPASCQDCHMSTYPGICEADPDATPGQRGDEPAGGGVNRGRVKRPGFAAFEDEPEEVCPPGTRFSARAPGAFPRARVADNSPEATGVTTHYFSGVDLPLSREFEEKLIDEPTVDLAGVPLSARRRRDLLLKATFRFEIRGARAGGGRLEIPIEVENIGAGHRVPAGFSQEREFWVHMVVRDGDGRIAYEVGKIDRNDEDLRDKVFARVNTNPSLLDRQGRPEGLFGADVRDGPDVPQWEPPPILGGSNFKGRGLINFQNGFLRCVRCIGAITPDGRCEAVTPEQREHHAARFVDGDYDIDTGECRSNLTGMNAFLETYYPVGALDATRGLVKGPDAIIDTRSVPPNRPIRYTYDLSTSGRRGPFTVTARLLFRSFPPFLVRAFADYEREQNARGLRPSGPLVTPDMLRRLEVVELSRVTAEVR
ncbi:MAG TPA: hypothetical protein VE093_08485 [Polyangiaceae bacterium]|nr:hypothetical protein [Polyangiaceae bacterium]